MKNLISSFNIDGLQTEDQDQIMKALINFDNSLYSKSSSRDAWFGIWKGKAISAQNASLLEISQ